MEILNCEKCGSKPVDHYVYIQCPHCGLSGPWTNGGVNDDHADNVDHQHAITFWNILQKEIKK